VCFVGAARRIVNVVDAAYLLLSDYDAEKYPNMWKIADEFSQLIYDSTIQPHYSALTGNASRAVIQDVRKRCG